MIVTLTLARCCSSLFSSLYTYTLEIIIDLPLGFPINNIISLHKHVYILLLLFYTIFLGTDKTGTSLSSG